MTQNKLNTTLKPKVFVAMSGGVDSSVAAALLKQHGFKVSGVFFKPWQPEKGVKFCSWKEDRQEALRVSEILGIPFKTWDFSKEYEKAVGKYMIEAYGQGLTPNPDVQCNKEIKFGLFLKKALAEGADYIATGHYVRLKPEILNSKLEILNRFQNQKFKLLKARDRNKDQSYFLWTLAQPELRHCLFPMGNYTKPEVRTMAKKMGLPNHAKKDSQGICFIGQLDLKEFLERYLDSRRGKIIDQADGQIVGEHEGAWYYTIGQRQGLRIGNGQGPYFVTGKNLKKNLLFVCRQPQISVLSARRATLNKINFLYPLRDKQKMIKIMARTRYRQPLQTATLKILPRNCGELIFVKPIRAIAPGQSAVFYRGQELLGGGIIG